MECLGIGGFEAGERRPRRLDLELAQSGAKAACVAAWLQRQPPDTTVESLRFRADQVGGDARFVAPEGLIDDVVLQVDNFILEEQAVLCGRASPQVDLAVQKCRLYYSACVNATWR